MDSSARDWIIRKGRASFEMYHDACNQDDDMLVDLGTWMGIWEDLAVYCDEIERDERFAAAIDGIISRLAGWPDHVRRFFSKRGAEMHKSWGVQIEFANKLSEIGENVRSGPLFKPILFKQLQEERERLEIEEIMTHIDKENIAQIRKHNRDMRLHLVREMWAQHEGVSVEELLEAQWRVERNGGDSPLDVARLSEIAK